MRKFILGIIATLLVLGLRGLAVATLGLMPTNADATPPRLERRVAAGALDASMERHASRAGSPIPLERSFYPPVPQLILDPLDDPEWHIYYAVRTGVRYTGMPAWDKALSDQDIWKVTAFLARIQTLPPGAQDYWKKSFGVGPSPAGSEKREDER
jgi:hypothetical protein